ncbi:Response regulator receiver domain-containing protein [Quadrisphaera granulorum]|uniref:Response regulator receiver domain-containing protein n=1 Tax=Quadrisphaera granulorum TaxID=317664 RepID=A0A316AFQ4_9ACTN|nr:response regulator [Quadrisphaera granulorum]PWJ56088.1 response regulator receiver domain-containing protein [Quadrisphaera granulorum]SZE94722.1 Response regulator receiver domain-containing protein [Quadrisphaera granulorum]
MTTVLVADDDLDIRELVAFKLAQAGYEVRSAPDGAAALDLARAGGVDIVVLDLMMPGLSGLDVCAELRRQEATADLPVIMLTARAQDQDVASGFAAGADDYVVKPFSPRELVSRVQAVLGRTRP